MSGTPFDRFDKSGLRPESVERGYAIWSRNYDAMLTDNLDGPILRGFAAALAEAGTAVVDMGCGTGRTGVFAAAAKRGASITGVDLCPEMLEIARGKGVYRSLLLADMLETGLPECGFDVALNVLSACHVADLAALYSEAARLLRPGGIFALVDFHPHMLLCGKGTCFPADDGRLVAIENFVHQLSDHAEAAADAGFKYVSFDESLVTLDWIRQGLNMPEFLGHPIGFGYLWRAGAGEPGSKLKTR